LAIPLHNLLFAAALSPNWAMIATSN